MCEFRHISSCSVPAKSHQKLVEQLQGQGLEVQIQKDVSILDFHLASPFFNFKLREFLCVQRLAAQASSEGSGSSVSIHWYIMTSPFTDEATQKFFENHKYFGLEANQVTFFQQGTIPCVSNDGRFIMETPFKVAKAPDGNGGVYSALKYSKLLEDMASRGIKYVDCYGVDNALVRVADPAFVGYFIDKGVAAAAKVVRKAYPQEKVGVFVRRGKGGPLTVVEYNELDQSLASAINQQTGRLRFCWSNVCLHIQHLPSS
ncbi:UDP-N-ACETYLGLUCOSAMINE DIPHOSPHORYLASE 1 [Salix koriyanagi]|uniref:UDP-N-acetylglucosamine diphosphorylase n=1 Tax=Salix koriyanagi TaxID=2511006 RepID=A0A9Q0T5C9_9ROSI|nr:UDP-N-ACETYLGLUCOSAMINE DIPHOSPHORYLASE 1 [Salix koriyanagi]